MKKILSSIVAALAAFSFAALVSAADVPTTQPAGTAPAAETTKPEAKPMKKHAKHRAHQKHRKQPKAAKKAGAPAPAPAPVPAPPAAQ